MLRFTQIIIMIHCFTLGWFAAEFLKTDPDLQVLYFFTWASILSSPLLILTGIKLGYLLMTGEHTQSPMSLVDDALRFTNIFGDGSQIGSNGFDVLSVFVIWVFGILKVFFCILFLFFVILERGALPDDFIIKASKVAVILHPMLPYLVLATIRLSVSSYNRK